MPQSRALLPHKALVPRAFFIVPYLTPEEVARMGQACQGRHQARDELLIFTLFPTGLFPVKTGIYMPNNFNGLYRRPLGWLT